MKCNPLITYQCTAVRVQLYNSEQAVTSEHSSMTHARTAIDADFRGLHKNLCCCLPALVFISFD